jgi:ankyrin repeat protein
MTSFSPFDFPYGTPLHWATFARSAVAVNFLVEHGANINASYHDCDLITTPLAMSVYHGDVEMVELLLHHGANVHVVNSYGLTLLHAADIHRQWYGPASQRWHSWIRHGVWEDHLKSTEKIVQLLVAAGADLERQTTTRTPETPILTAAKMHNGAFVLALLRAGANPDVEDTSRSTTLHLWILQTATAIDYPESYLIVLENLAQATKNINAQDERQDTPLMLIARGDDPYETFRASLNILASTSTPLDVNADNYIAKPALHMVFESGVDSMEKAELLMDHGADIHYTTEYGHNIVFAIANNRKFSDEVSAEYIKKLLIRANACSEEGFEYFARSGVQVLGSVCNYAKPKTLELLLSLGIGSHLNDIDTEHDNRTALDTALDNAEYARQAYMNNIEVYKWGPDKERALKAGEMHDERQGDSRRACH